MRICVTKPAVPAEGGDTLRRREGQGGELRTGPGDARRAQAFVVLVTRVQSELRELRAGNRRVRNAKWPCLLTVLLWFAVYKGVFNAP